MSPRVAIFRVMFAIACAGGCDGEREVAATSVERAYPVRVAGAAMNDAVETAETGDAVATADGAPDTSPDTAEPDSGVADDTADDTATPPAFPFVHEGNTMSAARDAWDGYACAPDTDEGGPEDVFRFAIDHLAILRATVDDVSGDGVDVDVHLLSGDGPETCVRRDNKALAWVVRPGTWTIAVDTWVGDDGVPRAGAYRLEVSLLPLDSGRCANTDVAQRQFWSACAAGPEALDCADDGTTRTLRVPSLGPVVGEAHLVTVDEDFAGDGWPTALRDQIERHYQISEAATGYHMDRGEPWAPEGEGGSHWGGGATGQKLPVIDEAWYVNMYWRDRPAKGRRMLVVEPWSGRAVVTAAGWETGPGSNTAIGGACEEIHDHLGSHHRQDLVMGFLVDDTLPLGPITCW